MMQQLQKLPGVGEKTAQRLAFFLISLPLKQVEEFSSVIKEVRTSVKYCSRCFNISRTAICHICSDPKRDSTILCVVSEPRDVMAIERTHDFRGLYHILGGLISPLDGIHPELLRIQELIERVKTENFSELILAISPTIEGDATSVYLTQILAPYSIKLSKLAHGLPMGADLDYTDELTLQKALSGRTLLRS